MSSSLYPVRIPFEQIVGNPKLRQPVEIGTGVLQTPFTFALPEMPSAAMVGIPGGVEEIEEARWSAAG
jgi:hypothetical protein